ncbi:MAG TPA: histidine kinase, partial [Polyangia bacterium]
MDHPSDFNHQIHELDRRRQVAEGLRDILAVLNSNLPLEDILGAINRQAQALLGADAVAIYRLQPNGTLTVQSSIGLDADYVSLAAIPLGALATGRAALERQPINMPDIAQAQAELNDPNNRLSQVLSRLTQNYQAILSIPLIIRNEIYGALTLYYHQQSSLAEEEQDLAVSFSHQAALAIENANLRAQIEENAVAAERSRLGRELHDSVTQMLFSANLIADVLPTIWQHDPQQALKGLDELHHLTHGALAEMRTLLAELRPSALEAATLEELLHRLVDSASARLRQPVNLALTCKT